MPSFRVDPGGGGGSSGAAEAMALPFAVDPGEWLEREPGALFEEGAVFRATAGEHDPRVVPFLAVAWLEEPAGVAAVRTFTARAGGILCASEQWRLLAGGRRWTVSATTALADQPAWGPRLAEIVATFRVWTEGDAQRAEVLGGAGTCVLVTARPGGMRAVAEIAPETVPLALAAWLGLGPRPRPTEPAIRLAPGPMAVLIGRGQADGHDIAPDVASALQRRLDAGVRHWTVRAEGPGRRRNLEVLEGDGGIWRLRAVGGLVELLPTSTTDVVRELVALCENCRAVAAAASAW